MPLHPQAQAFLDLVASMLAVPLERMTPALARQGLELALKPPGPPEPVAALRDLRVDGHTGPRPARLYTPEGTGPFGIVLYLHSGGWLAGSLDAFDATCRGLTRASGCMVLSLNCRLVPEHEFPAAPLDGLAALRWLAAHAGELGADPARLRSPATAPAATWQRWWRRWPATRAARRCGCNCWCTR